MSTWLRLVLALAACGIAVPTQAGDGFPWPDGQRAAVSLSYDDALPSQLDNALPALNQRGFKASFYLVMSSETVRTRLGDWRAAARMGHELGNHSLFHQCSANGPDRAWVDPDHDLDALSVAQMQAQVALASTMLHAIDGSTEFTYTLPCGDRNARDGDYVEGLADRFLGIKVIGTAVVPDMATLDRAAVPVQAPAGVTGAQLIALVEDAGRRGTMVNFTFHGIGGDHLSVTTEAHAQLLDFLAAHRDLYWTDTFRNQMRWVRDRHAEAR